jgi:TolA-binding protein
MAFTGGLEAATSHELVQSVDCNPEECILQCSGAGRKMMTSRKIKVHKHARISVCALAFLFGAVAPAQVSSAHSDAASTTHQSSESSVITEYAKFLQDEDKAHREYLEKLYTVTSGVLGVLVAVGVAVIGYAQFKTRKDVEDAVNARFNVTVDREIRLRVTTLSNQLTEFQQTLDNLRDDARETKKTLQDVRLLAADTRSLVEDKPAEPSQDEPEARSEIREGPVIEEPTSPLNEDENEILRAIGESRYSLRTKSGVIQEAARKGVDAERTRHSFQTLTRKGYIGMTLGKTGGERWYVTEAGRKMLLSHKGGQA